MLSSCDCDNWLEWIKKPSDKLQHGNTVLHEYEDNEDCKKFTIYNLFVDFQLPLFPSFSPPKLRE